MSALSSSHNVGPEQDGMSIKMSCTFLFFINVRSKCRASAYYLLHLQSLFLTKNALKMFTLS